MNNPSRRDLCVALTALATTGLRTEAQQASDTDPHQSSAGHRLTQSEIFAFDTLPFIPSSNGGGMRPVFQGTLATGEYLEVHETTLPPGQMPHPPHRHTHSELILMRQGKLEVTSDALHGTVEAGGIVFNASGTLHGAKSIGDVPAIYFIVAVGIQKMLA
jgi:quercetin dioxygenase-like cupin family protein